MESTVPVEVGGVLAPLQSEDGVGSEADLEVRRRRPRCGTKDSPEHPDRGNHRGGSCSWASASGASGWWPLMSYQCDGHPAVRRERPGGRHDHVESCGADAGHARL